MDTQANKCPDCKTGTFVNGQCDNCKLSIEDLRDAKEFLERYLRSNEKGN